MALSRKMNDDGDGMFFEGKDPVFKTITKDGEEVVFSLDLEEADALIPEEKQEQLREFDKKIHETYTIHLDDESK